MGFFTKKSWARYYFLALLNAVLVLLSSGIFLVSRVDADVSCAMQYNVLPNSYIAFNDTLNNFVTMYQVEAGGFVGYLPDSVNSSPIRLLNMNITFNRIFTNDTISRLGTESSASKLILLADFYNIGRWNRTLAVPMNGGAVRADWLFFNNITVDIRNPTNDLQVNVRGLPLGSTIGRLLQLGTGAGTYPTDYSNTSAGWDFIWRTLDPRIDQSPQPWTWGGFMRLNLEIACPCDRVFPISNFLGNPGIPPDYSLHLRPRYSREPTKTFYYAVTCAYSQLPLVYGFDYNFYTDPRQKVIRFRAFLQPLETLPQSERNLLLLDMVFQGVPGNTPRSGYGAPVDANSPFLVEPYSVNNALGNANFPSTLKSISRRSRYKNSIADAKDSILPGLFDSVPLLKHLLAPNRPLTESTFDIEKALNNHREKLQFNPTSNLRSLASSNLLYIPSMEEAGNNLENHLDEYGDEQDEELPLNISIEEESRRLDLVSSGLENLLKATFLQAMQQKQQTQRGFQEEEEQDMEKIGSAPYVDPYTPLYVPPVPPLRGRLYNDLPTIGPAPIFGDDIQYFRFIKGTLDDLVNNAQYDIVTLNSSIFPAPGVQANQPGPYLQVGSNANTLSTGYGAWFPFQFRMRRGKLWRMGNFTILINDPTCPKIQVADSQEKIMLDLKGPSPSSNSKSILLEFARLSGKSYGAVILFCTLGIGLGRTYKKDHLALIVCILLIGCLFHKEETPSSLKEKEKKTDN